MPGFASCRDSRVPVLPLRFARLLIFPATVGLASPNFVAFPSSHFCAIVRFPYGHTLTESPKRQQLMKTAIGGTSYWFGVAFAIQRYATCGARWCTSKWTARYTAAALPGGMRILAHLRQRSNRLQEAQVLESVRELGMWAQHSGGLLAACIGPFTPLSTYSQSESRISQCVMLCLMPMVNSQMHKPETTT